MQTVFNVEFQVSGTISQVIELYEGMKQEEFREKMKKGDIATSIGHDMCNGKVYDMSEGKFEEIGQVVGQESQDDMEFMDMKLEEEQVEIDKE
jgi:hypothetical protein